MLSCSPQSTPASYSCAFTGFSTRETGKAALITLHVFVAQASDELTSSGGGSMAAEEVVSNWRAMQEAAAAAKQAQVLTAGVRRRRGSP